MTDHTPASIRAMALAGMGVDDIHVRTGWSYRHIAHALAKGTRDLWPWAALAARRAADAQEAA